MRFVVSIKGWTTDLISLQCCGRPEEPGAKFGQGRGNAHDNGELRSSEDTTMA